MIPAFPEFKKIGVDDREVVESHTHKYPPYSDFNFTSLWAWDTSNERMISELDGNLVVRFTDYKTDEPFLSFLGSNETERTARTLMNYCKEHGLPEVLKLIPEISTHGIQSPAFRVEEDRDNFDYIYSVPELSALEGGKFKGRRNFVNRFMREHPAAHVEIVDLANTDAQKNIFAILDSWAHHKQAKNKAYETEHEKTALTRLFETARSHELIVTAIFEDKIMLAFSIEEILPDQFCIGHFWKADATHAGIFDVLMQRKAQHLETLGLAFLNYEQDLGVEGLRQSKMDYRPIDFLKKYRVSLGG